MDQGAISFIIWMNSPTKLQPTKDHNNKLKSNNNNSSRNNNNNSSSNNNNNSNHLLSPPLPTKLLEADELFLPINCQRTNSKRSDHCQCLTLLVTTTINNNNNNNKTIEETETMVFSHKLHQDGILSILLTLMSMMTTVKKQPDFQYSAPCRSRSYR